VIPLLSKPENRSGKLKPQTVRNPGIRSKLKSLIRKASARTYQELWQAVDHLFDWFAKRECYYFFKIAGYSTD